MEKKQHPSYGMLQLSRSSIGGNGTALFGSSIMHNDVIRLTISNGFMEREDSQDRYYVKTSRKNCIVEVDMSYTAVCGGDHITEYPRRYCQRVLVTELCCPAPSAGERMIQASPCR